MKPLAKALHDAGYVPPADRIRTIAVDALGASPNNWDGARDAFWLGVKGDAELLWALLEPWRRQAADAALREAAEWLRANAPVQVAPNKDSETPRGDAGLEDGPGQIRPDDQLTSARPVPPPSHPHIRPVPARPPEVRPTAAQSRSPTEATFAAATDLIRRSVLDTFLIDGKPIGDCTSREANAYADKHVRRNRFIRLLTQNLPPDDPIKKHRDPDLADRLCEEVGAKDLTDA